MREKERRKKGTQKKLRWGEYEKFKAEIGVCYRDIFIPSILKPITLCASNLGGAALSEWPLLLKSLLQLKLVRLSRGCRESS